MYARLKQYTYALATPIRRPNRHPFIVTTTVDEPRREAILGVDNVEHHAHLLDEPVPVILWTRGVGTWFPYKGAHSLAL